MTPKYKPNQKEKGQFIDRAASFLSYVALIISAAYGFRKLLEALPENAAYTLTALIVSLLVYIIYRNK